MYDFIEFLFRLLNIVLTLFLAAVVLAAACYIVIFGILWRMFV